MAGGWIYNSRSGDVALETGVMGLLGSGFVHLGIGWHGPFPSLQALVNFYDQNKQSGWVPPLIGRYLKDFPSLTGVTPEMRQDASATQKIKNQAQGTAGAAAANVGGAIGIHGDLRHFTIRAVEVVLGVVLVIVALEAVMKETGATNIVQGVKKYGKMVAK